MRHAGWSIGRDQVARLMKRAGLHGARRGRKPVTTRPAHQADHRPDLVERQFTADGPNRLWVADITYVRILAGFCYLAFITDVFTRRIVGWAVSTSLHTDALPLLALEQALAVTGASRSHGGLIHHSDRGSQGGFNWSSQHPGLGGVRQWRRRTGPRRRAMCPRVRVVSGVLIGRCVRRCVRPGGLSPRGRCSGSSGV